MGTALLSGSKSTPSLNDVLQVQEFAHYIAEAHTLKDCWSAGDIFDRSCKAFMVHIYCSEERPTGKSKMKKMTTGFGLKVEAGFAYDYNGVSLGPRDSTIFGWC